MDFPLSSLCALFHVDEEDVRGPWANREPEYNRNLTITQGDTVCYQLAYLNDGAPVDIRGWDIKAYIKLNFSDEDFIETFSTELVQGTINVVQLSLTEQQTTCLPVNELIYSCEVIDTASVITQNSKIEKITQGYLRVEPEVTRDDSLCSVFGMGPTASQTAAEKQAAAERAASSSLCCNEFFLRRVPDRDQWIFKVEVPTEEIAYKDISYWEADLTINPETDNSVNEIELIQNQMDPMLVSTGYDMVYPIGGGRYRFIDRNSLTYKGTLLSVFSVTVPMSTYDSALFKIRYYTHKGCVTHWCQTSMKDELETHVNCCPSESGA